MSEMNEDSPLVIFIRNFENNFVETFKNFESLILFVLGLIFTPSVISLIEIFRNEKIPNSTALTNASFYAIIVFIFVDLYCSWLSKKKNSAIRNELKTLFEEKSTIVKDNEQLNKNLNEIRQNLNEAQEAIASIKIENLDEAKEISSRFLAFIFNEIGFSSNERVSLYMLVDLKSEKKDEKIESEFFHLFGRFSINSFFNKTSRLRFSKNEGVIGQAFIEEYINNGPIYLSENDATYLKEVKEQGINKEVARNFKMKSRSFYPYVISENLGSRIGVLLFESMVVQKDFAICDINELLEKYDSIIIEILKYNYSILKKTNINEDKI